MRDRPDMEALKADLDDKKAMLAAIDAGTHTLPLEQLTSFRKRVAALEAEIRKLDVSRS
jgi:hypothetical protein